MHGGLGHLPADEIAKVLDTKTVPQHLCCKSPYWLYRIYQDTEVDIPEIIKLVDEALEESRTQYLPKIYTKNYYETDIKLPWVKNITCIDSASKPAGIVWAKWEPVWNGAIVDHWEVLVNNDGKIYPTIGNQTSAQIEGYDGIVIFFVRSVYNNTFGAWGNSGRCAA